MKIFIYQHLGMGDMISNNGLIRYIVEINPKTKFFYIFCKIKYLQAIKFMYRDLKKIKVIPVIFILITFIQNSKLNNIQFYNI